MPYLTDSMIVNFKKFEFSHQVALVGKDHFICYNLLSLSV